MKAYAIVLAAGEGKRLGSKTPKAFIKINGKEIYKYSVEKFINFRKIKKIILVVPPKYEKKVDITHKKLLVTTGSKTRNESFENGLAVVVDKLKPLDQIIIHDAARIFVMEQDIKSILKSNQDIVTLAYKPNKPNSSDLWIKPYSIQTPQMCRFWLYKNIQNFNSKGKDLFTYLNIVPLENNVIISSNKEKNFKITFKNDLKIAEEAIKKVA